MTASTWLGEGRYGWLEIDCEAGIVSPVLVIAAFAAARPQGDVASDTAARSGAASTGPASQTAPTVHAVTSS